MSKPTQYASVLAKIGAERSKLLNGDKLKTLADSRNLSDLAAQLRDTTYQEQISHIVPPLAANKLERAYQENLIDAYLKIVKNAPKHAAPFLRLYLVWLELEQIKALLKATSAKLGAEQKLAKVYFSVEDYLQHHAFVEEAAKASTLTQVVQAFKGTNYVSCLNMALKKYEETASTASFDISIDNYYYEKLYEAYQALSKSERVYAEFYVSMQVDGFTLLTILRGKILNLEPNWLRLILPQNTFNLNKSVVEAAVTAIDFDSALKTVLESHYGKYFKKDPDPYDTVANAEKTLRKTVLQHAQSNAITEIFTIGLPLSFMTRKQAEVYNLSALSLGVEAAMKPEAIRNLLLL